MLNKLLIISFIFLFSNVALSQKFNGDVVVTGDSLVGKYLDGESLREVIGNVIIIQDDIRIECDTALQNITLNKIDLIGRVVLTQDTIKLKTNSGTYWGNDKISYSSSGVELSDGKINLLAKTGYYFFSEKKALFYSEVFLNDSLNTLKTDSLIYYTDTEIASAVGNVELDNIESKITADSLESRRKDKIHIAKGNVIAWNIENNSKIFCGYLKNNSEIKYSIAENEPLFVQIDSSESVIDTLLIKALKMESFTDSSNIFIATDSVKIIRGQFASINEYSIFYRNDNTIKTYKLSEDSEQPIIWFDASRLTGDSVTIFTDNNNLERLEIKNDAFILSKLENYSERYNQVSGSYLKMYFDSTGIKNSNVEGNVLSIYYIFDEEQANGVIKSSSESAIIYFLDDAISEVRLYGSPSTEYHPENKTLGNELNFLLPQFRNFESKPSKSDLIKNN